MFFEEAAKDEILDGVEWGLVVDGDAFHFFEESFEELGHRRFGVLLDFDSAAFLRALFREGSDDEHARRFDALPDGVDVV